MKYEFLDPDDMQNYNDHISDAKEAGQVPKNAKLECIYQYFDFQQWVGSVLFMRATKGDAEMGTQREEPCWLVATPEWDTFVFSNAAELYRYLSTIKERLRYDMYGRVQGDKWALQTTASVDVGSYVTNTAAARERFGDDRATA